MSSSPSSPSAPSAAPSLEQLLEPLTVVLPPRIAAFLRLAAMMEGETPERAAVFAISGEIERMAGEDFPGLMEAMGWPPGASWTWTAVCEFLQDPEMKPAPSRETLEEVAS